MSAVNWGAVSVLAGSILFTLFVTLLFGQRGFVVSLAGVVCFGLPLKVGVDRFRSRITTLESRVEELETTSDSQAR